jgi:dephospho-CoA kinase
LVASGEFDSSTVQTGLRVLGVLGGVGSGKSTAARILAEELPAAHLDADAEVARLFADSKVVEQIDQAFGGGLKSPEGVLDRAELGKRVFAQPELRRQLEAILHPAVRRALWNGLAETEATALASGTTAAVSKPGGWAILDVPLLLENGLSQACDFLIFVRVPDAIRADRACARHNWELATWRAREAAQASLAEKESVADATLVNASGVEDLRAAVRELLPRLRALPPRSLRDRWPDSEKSPVVADPNA